MPRPYPKEFREDVIRVARDREPGVRVKDIAGDSGISESCLNNWLAQADRDEGLRSGPSSGEVAENRELRPNDLTPAFDENHYRHPPQPTSA